MGQPLRRGHDRADRLLVGLLRHERLRRAADARDGLPLPAVLSAGRGPHRPGRHPARTAGPPRADRARGGRRRRRDARRAHAAARGEVRPQPSRPGAGSLPPRPGGPGRAGLRLGPGAPGASAADRQGRERSGRGGRDLHLRRRPADGLGGALSGDERQAPAAGLVLARLDGQCADPGHRRPEGLSPAARWSRCPATAASPC